MEITSSNYGAIVINKPFIEGKKIQWFIDNQNVVIIVSKDRTKTILQKLALGMLSTCFKYNINIDMVWIPGSENDKDEFLSCIVDNDHWSISEYIYQIIYRVRH